MVKLWEILTEMAMDWRWDCTSGKRLGQPWEKLLALEKAPSLNMDKADRAWKFEIQLMWLFLRFLKKRDLI